MLTFAADAISRSPILVFLEGFFFMRLETRTSELSFVHLVALDVQGSRARAGFLEFYSYPLANTIKKVFRRSKKITPGLWQDPFVL